MKPKRPGVGVGIIIVNKKGNVLIGKRTGSHAPKYSIPGGHLENGESFEKAAIREALEEHGITLVKPRVIAITNNLETFKSEEIHNISVILLADKFEGEPQILEPLKCIELIWCNPKRLPEPHFDASRLAITCFLNKEFYVGIYE